MRENTSNKKPSKKLETTNMKTITTDQQAMQTHFPKEARSASAALHS